MVETGATAATSGAVAFDRSASASCTVERRRGAEAAAHARSCSSSCPARPRAGSCPAALIWSCTLALGALAEADGEDDRGDADEDAEHRERRAQPMRCGPPRSRCENVSRQLMPAPAPDDAEALVARVRTDRRGSRSIRCARVGNVVLVGDQHDRAAVGVELLEQPSTSAVEVESRLPVGSSARITAGLGDKRARDGDPLLLAAGQLARPVVGPIGEPDLLERVERPGAALRGTRRPA